MFIANDRDSRAVLHPRFVFPPLPPLSRSLSLSHHDESICILFILDHAIQHPTSASIESYDDPTTTTRHWVCPEIYRQYWKSIRNVNYGFSILSYFQHCQYFQLGDAANFRHLLLVDPTTMLGVSRNVPALLKTYSIVRNANYRFSILQSVPSVFRNAVIGLQLLTKESKVGHSAGPKIKG